MTNQDKAGLYDTGLRLWADWTTMWNGRPELARALVAPRFCLHLTSPSPTPEASVTDPASTEAWVRAHREKFEKLTFHTTAGPFVDVSAGIVAGPWFADVVVGGVASSVCGMDTIAFSEGLITEYWTMSKPVDTVGRWGSALNLALR